MTTQSISYDVLRAEKIVETIDQLSVRIEQRFGEERGLYNISRRLHGIAAQAKQRSSWIAKPILSLRIGAALGALTILAASVSPLFFLGLPEN